MFCLCSVLSVDTLLGAAVTGCLVDLPWNWGAVSIMHSIRGTAVRQQTCDGAVLYKYS